MMLESVDGRGTIDLPAGLTTIGRGPLLGVSDKRVSRNHALLEVLDEKLCIKPIHINPCFHQSSSGDQLLPLEKDKWHWLNSGDCFSLLPDKYIYKVISSSSDQTLRNSDLSSFEDDECNTGNLQMGKGEFKKGSEESEDYSEKPTKSSKTMTRDSKEKSSAFEKNNTLENMSKNEQLENGNAPLNPVQRKRVLPAWMLQVAKEIQSTSSTVNKQGKGRGRGRGRSDAEQTKTEVTQPGRKRNESFENVKENEASDQPLEKKGRRKNTEASENEKCTQSKSNTKENNFGTNSTHVKRKEQKNQFGMSPHTEENWKLGNVEGRNQQDCSPQQLHEASNWAVSDKEEEEEELGLLCRQGEQEQLQCIHMQGSHSENRSPRLEESEPAGGASAFQAKERKRRACVYGTNCYRKNPVHFQEFTHPGDPDYEDPLSEEDDVKPECPFGTACYRKNPQHKEEYKHTRLPENKLRRPRRKVAQKGKSALDNESDDEPNQYDLDDSFIDDEEDDLDPTDEDSDWEPSSDTNEDINTLRKEANLFVNKN